MKATPEALKPLNPEAPKPWPGLSNAIAPQLSSGSLLFLGPATSGKTSSLREAAASLAHTYQAPRSRAFRVQGVWGVRGLGVWGFGGLGLGKARVRTIREASVFGCG